VRQWNDALPTCHCPQSYITERAWPDGRGTRRGESWKQYRTIGNFVCSIDWTRVRDETTRHCNCNCMLHRTVIAAGTALPWLGRLPVAVFLLSSSPFSFFFPCLSLLTPSSYSSTYSLLFWRCNKCATKTWTLSRHALANEPTPASQWRGAVLDMLVCVCPPGAPPCRMPLPGSRINSIESTAGIPQHHQTLYSHKVMRPTPPKPRPTPDLSHFTLIWRRALGHPETATACSRIPVFFSSLFPFSAYLAMACLAFPLPFPCPFPFSPPRPPIPTRHIRF
jgi:hypothetical protein